MADKEISALTAAAALAAADLLVISQGGNSRKATGAQLQALVSSQPNFVVGRWYPMEKKIQAAAGGSGQNTIQFVMFSLPRPITVSDLGCVITTLHAANNLQLAIYAADATTGYPTGNALAVTGNISTAATGALSADITGADVSLAAGFYWAAVNQSGATAQVIGVTAGFSQNSGMVGSTTLANIAGGTSNNNIKFTFASTFNTWPDMTGQTLTEALGAPSPLLYLKAA